MIGTVDPNYAQARILGLGVGIKKRFDLVGFSRIHLDFREFIGFFVDFRTDRNDHKESKKAGKGKSTDSKLHAPAKMMMYIPSSPATLTGSEEKKTGPSRFIADFLTELTELSKLRIYKHAYSQFTLSAHSVYTELPVGKLKL